MSTNDFFNFCGEIVERQTDRELDLIGQVCHFSQSREFGNTDEMIKEVQEHFVYKDLRKKCLKQKKDLNAPKKGRSSYTIFSSDVRAEVAAANPNLKMTELSAKLGEKWAKASKKTKAEYQKKADEEKERYKKEKELYDQQAASTGTEASDSADGPQPTTNEFFNFCGELVQRQTDRERALIEKLCKFIKASSFTDIKELIQTAQDRFVYKDIRKKCLKQKKDLNAPKKPRSSYMIFCADVRSEVAAANPTLKMTELAKKLGEKWASTTEEVKAEFQKRADEEKEKYAKDNEEYNKKLHEQKGSFSGVGSSNSSEIPM